MTPGQLNITIQRGEAFQLQITWNTAETTEDTPEPRDLTGWDATAKVRHGGTSLTFTPTIDGPEGTITLDATASAVDALTSGKGTWGLKVSPPNSDDSPVVLLAGTALIYDDPTA